MQGLSLLNMATFYLNMIWTHYSSVTLLSLFCQHCLEYTLLVPVYIDMEELSFLHSCCPFGADRQTFVSFLCRWTLLSIWLYVSYSNTRTNSRAERSGTLAIVPLTAIRCCLRGCCVLPCVVYSRFVIRLVRHTPTCVLRYQPFCAGYHSFLHFNVLPFRHTLFITICVNTFHLRDGTCRVNAIAPFTRFRMLCCISFMRRPSHALCYCSGAMVGGNSFVCDSSCDIFNAPRVYRLPFTFAQHLVYAEQRRYVHLVPISEHFACCAFISSPGVTATCYTTTDIAHTRTFPKLTFIHLPCSSAGWASR